MAPPKRTSSVAKYFRGSQDSRIPADQVVNLIEEEQGHQNVETRTPRRLEIHVVHGHVVQWKQGQKMRSEIVLQRFEINAGKRKITVFDGVKYKITQSRIKIVLNF